MTETVILDSSHPMEPALNRIAGIIREGGVIAYPTDTFYGLGCDPFNEAAVERLFAIKQRERNRPILLIISDPSLVLWLSSKQTELFNRLTERFWPGPLTLVLHASDRLPSALTSETGTIGIRFPNDDRCRQIVKAAGGVLTGTSANLTGQPSAASAQDVRGQLGDLLDLIVDGGPTAGGAPSTVLDLTQDPPRIVREGAVTQQALEQFLNESLKVL